MKLQNNKSKRGTHGLSLLASSVLLVLHTPAAHALQVLDDDALSRVNGQDGLMIDTQYDQIQIDRAYWEDRTGSSANADTALRGYANNISITGSNLGTTFNVDVNSTGANQAGIDLAVNSRYGTIAAESFNICDENGANCGDSLGGLTIQSTENAGFALSTTNGIFNQDSSAELTLTLRNLNVYITQADAAIRNQLILKDFNFNFFGKGAIWVDGANGFQLVSEGAGNYVDLLRVDDSVYAGKTKPGLNIELMYKGNAPAGVFNTTGAQGVIRLGASGRALESSLVFRGIDARDAADNLLGFSFSGADVAGSGTNATVMGSTGLALRMKAEFTNAGNAAGGEEFTLELAHAGDNAYGFEFSDLKPLQVRTANGGGPVNQARSYLDTGNVYLNLANTKRLQMPVNTVLNSAPLGASTITANSDYSHLVHDAATNPNTLVTAVRGLEFQAVSRRGRFLVSNNVDISSPDHPDFGAPDPANPPSKSNSWGLGLPIYNLNSNIAIYGKTVGSAQRMGFSLGLSTEGVNAGGDKSTSILLIDGAPNDLDGDNPTSRYFGLRNIDMLITAYGDLGLEDGKINLNLPKLLIAASMQVAAGYLPGARYASNSVAAGCTSNESACYVPVNSFTNKNDVLFGLNLKLDGSMNLNLIPGGNTLANNNLRFQGWYQLNSGAIQIVEPIDGTVLGFDNISGRIDFDNSIKINRNSVGFSYDFTFNPARSAADVFRIRDVNLYPFNSVTETLQPAQRLGEMVITGGTLHSSMNIVPR